MSNASELLPEPDKPVITTSLCFGISMLIFFKLCVRAPRTRKKSIDIDTAKTGYAREGQPAIIALYGAYALGRATTAGYTNPQLKFASRAWRFQR